MEKVIFETEDGVQIIGDYVETVKEAPVALLLHMMPATRASWRAFAEKLREAGWTSLAIDFRGHGDSVKKFQISDFRLQNTPATSSRANPPQAESRGISGAKHQILDYKQFSDREQQEKILDVRAAVRYLEQDRGISRDRLVIVGASIGANLALQYMVENPEVKKGVLLSPGLDYRGVKTDVLVKKLHPGQQVLLLASKDDTHDSFESIDALHALNTPQTDKREFVNLGHGTEMFERKPELMDEVVKWLAIN